MSEKANTIDSMESTVNIEKRKLGNLVASINEDKLWGNIRRKAKSDEGLQDLLNQAIMYYRLIEERT